MAWTRLSLPEMRERAAQSRRAYTNSARGRTCCYCGAPDTARMFVGRDKCRTCFQLLGNNGGRTCVYPKCHVPSQSALSMFGPDGKPLTEGAAFCRRHLWRPGYIKATILSKGKSLEMFFQANTPIRTMLGGRLLSDLTEPVLVLGPSEFWAYRIRRPIAIFGIDHVPTRDTAYTLLEFIHEPGRDEATGNYALTPEWFERRFGQGKHLKTWKRSFERTKQRFRLLGIDPTDVDMMKAKKVMSYGRAAWFAEEK